MSPIVIQLVSLWLQIRNSVAIAAALREAERRGFTSVVTGDGADELFAG